MIALVSIGLFLVIVHLLSRHFFSYWSRHGFPQMDAAFLVGSISDLFFFRKSFSNCFIDFYEKYKHQRFIGSYFSYKPVLIVNDPLVIQDILVSNFSSFTDRPRYVDEKRDPISAHLFNIGGQKWRDLRFKLSPTFSSGKIKGMFPIMRDCGRSLQNFLIRNSSNDKSVFNFIDLFAKYTTHNIVTVIFSIDSDCFSDPDNIFRKISANFAAPSRRQHIIDIFSFLIPNILHGLSIFNIRSVTAKVNDFVLSFVEKIVKHREETSFCGNDFLQLLIQLKNQGFISVSKHERAVEGGEMEPNDKILKKLTIDEIAAQVLVFFVGGE
jgi:cytochrome P450 family 6